MSDVLFYSLKGQRFRLLIRKFNSSQVVDNFELLLGHSCMTHSYIRLFINGVKTYFPILNLG